MFELVYRSSAIPNLTHTDISNILETAINFNSENSITGCLVYHNHSFLQILEGEENIIQELFVSIRQDVRHTDIELLHEDKIMKRLFKSWNMAYVDLNVLYNNNNTDRELFKSNFITYATLADKSNEASKLFWENAKSIIRESA
ncbi:BLUF domain-containing protein [Christiangramia salexigens]|uniref:BLUF domain-containing protein n=1 Tax=Christiangramia salexigens TaxID=1913577 RepID=A0A1L3J416_9FLAO|nr:BLUF domain-containing protein [Christiangramia salexigens]APG59878.1 hypothetical protein LPB144_05370 [Christiangramia salexigens]